MFFDAGKQAGHGAHDMGGLKGAPDGQLAIHFVHAGHAAAGFQRAGMGAVVVDHLFGDHFGAVDGLIGRFFVAHLPQEDVVVMLARAMRARHDAVQILTQDRRIGGKRLEGVNDHGKFFVINLDQLDGIGGDVAVGRDDKSHFLTLKQHLSIGQHHLLVTRQRGHPVQVQGCEVGGRQHRHHTGQGAGGIGVDRLYAGMCVRAAHEIAKQHALHFDVIDIVALALGKADILDAFAAAAQTFKLFDPFVTGWGLVVHSAASLAFISLAAARIALTMF